MEENKTKQNNSHFDINGLSKKKDKIAFMHAIFEGVKF
jgi:hypothetical protein